MNILIIGSGAREHALAHAISTSPSFVKPISRLNCIGPTLNPGIRDICMKSDGTYKIGAITDNNAICSSALNSHIDLAVIGPEAALEAGIADSLRQVGIAVFGPDRDLARIETSKSFARTFFSRFANQYCPKFIVASQYHEAEKAVISMQPRCVIKVDGLAGGKGVLVANEHLNSLAETLQWCQTLFQQNSVPVVIEEKLYGQEFSLMTVTDGVFCVHLHAVQDHKRAYDGENGPNTGGMGSYTGENGRLPFLNQQDIDQAKKLNEQTIYELHNYFGKPYRGVLYGGFMIVSDGIRLVEYNARFGDPEVMNLMAICESDVLEMLYGAATGTLSDVNVTLSSKPSVCLYAVPDGYPNKSEKGHVISMGTLDSRVDCFYGSVDIDADKRLCTAGSRTLAMVATAETLEHARSLVLDNIAKVRGPLRYRTDIASKEALGSRIEQMKQLRRPLRVGVMGSTRGTDLRYVLEMIEAGRLHASIELVFSDRENAGIIELAKTHGIPTAIGVRHGKNLRYERERIATAAFENANVDLIILIGYMRIISEQMCTRWKGRLFNIHPSLLPDFAGAMDTDVHAMAIRRMKNTGISITGCTVHMVEPVVDHGAIVIQKMCHIDEHDTVESLKSKVQALEGEALVDTIRMFALSGGKDMVFNSAQPIPIERA
ncbi:MAG: phosphoribosylamine--glycine ligase [Sphaerochaetaceae bacterium]